MQITPEQRRLSHSIESIITRADFTAATRINSEADAPAAKIQAFGHAAHRIEVARIAYEVIEAALPEIFKAYDAERSRLWSNESQLNYLVRNAIHRYYDGMNRHIPPSIGDWLVKVENEIGRSHLAERETLTQARADEHFRHPGVQHFIQRRPGVMMGITVLITLVITVIADLLVPG